MLLALGGKSGPMREFTWVADFFPPLLLTVRLVLLFHDRRENVRVCVFACLCGKSGKIVHTWVLSESERDLCDSKCDTFKGRR